MDVDYASLLPSLFQMNAGYFLIQLASEPNKERVYDLIGKNIRKDAKGVKQVAFIGVINPLSATVETPEQVIIFICFFLNLCYEKRKVINVF